MLIHTNPDSTTVIVLYQSNESDNLVTNCYIEDTCLETY